MPKHNRKPAGFSNIVSSAFSKAFGWGSMMWPESVNPSEHADFDVRKYDTPEIGAPGMGDLRKKERTNKKPPRVIAPPPGRPIPPPKRKSNVKMNVYGKGGQTPSKSPIKVNVYGAKGRPRPKSNVKMNVYGRGGGQASAPKSQSLAKNPWALGIGATLAGVALHQIFSGDDNKSKKGDSPPPYYNYRPYRPRW